jgi:hypothetical protein
MQLDHLVCSRQQNSVNDKYQHDTAPVHSDEDYIHGSGNSGDDNGKTAGKWTAAFVRRMNINCGEGNLFVTLCEWTSLQELARG